MKEHFQKLFAYQRWANLKIIDALREMSSPDEKCLELFSHILSAQLIWLARAKNGNDNFTVWQQRDLEGCVKVFNENSNDWEEFLEGFDERQFFESVSYKNTKGDEFQTSLKDILTHVVNHSTHHRGQIVFKLKDKIASLPTDYIFYTRDI